MPSQLNTNSLTLPWLVSFLIIGTFNYACSTLYFDPIDDKKYDLEPCSLVNFLPVTVKSKERMLIASQTIDKANG